MLCVDLGSLVSPVRFIDNFCKIIVEMRNRYCRGDFFSHPDSSDYMVRYNDVGMHARLFKSWNFIKDLRLGVNSIDGVTEKVAPSKNLRIYKGLEEAEAVMLD
jgi:hypothetical protein